MKKMEENADFGGVFAGKRGIFETLRPRDEEISKDKIVMTL